MKENAFLIMKKKAYTVYEYFKELGGDLWDKFAKGVPIGLVGKWWHGGAGHNTL